MLFTELPITRPCDGIIGRSLSYPPNHPACDLTAEEKRQDRLEKLSQPPETI